MSFDKTVNAVIEAIIKTLFEAEDRRLIGWMNRIIDTNNEFLGQPYAGFFYQGTWFQKSDISKGRYVRPTLNFSLWTEMDQYNDDLKNINNDRQIIKQTLITRLQNCWNNQDIRDALPDFLAEFLPYISEIERIRNEEFFIQTPRDLQQWNKVLPRIQVYAATRLIF